MALLMGSEAARRRSWGARLRDAAVLSLVAGVLAAAAGCEGPSSEILAGTAGSDNAYICFVPLEADEWAARVIELVNDERARDGKPPVSANAVLTRIAEDYACEMIEGDFFDHVSPITGSTVGSRALQYGYYFRKVGENLAGGQASPEQVMSEWMASDGHRANILDEDFVDIGVAVRTGGEYRIYWVQEFGLPR